MILLTGTSGNVGGAAARAMLSLNIPFRVLVRDADRLAEPIARSAEVVIADLQQPDSVAQALVGVSKALLVTPNGEQQVDIESAFVDAAKHAGIRHLVKVSSMEASPDAKSSIPRSHYRIEERIRTSGMQWTFLRPNFFMQNLLMQAAQIRASDTFTLPLGDAQTALVDARDVGRAATEILVGDANANACFEITGPKLMTFDDVAATLTATLGRTITYQRQSLDAFRAVLSQIIPSSAQVDGLVDLFAEIARGALARETDDYRQITGSEPTAFTSFVAEHAPSFGA